MGCSPSRTYPAVYFRDNQKHDPGFAFEAPDTGTWSELEIEAQNTHNALRAKHGAPRLSLNRDLCRTAQDYAELLAADRKFQHSPHKDRKWNGAISGENLAYSATTAKHVTATVSVPVQAWYDEIKDYSFTEPGYSPQTGHFSQLVWAASRQMGVGQMTYREGRWTHTLTVARYHPAGNHPDRFHGNVKPLQQ